jgi:ABC-type sugar transport system ATPase subunit
MNVLELANVVKRFGGVQALRGADLSARPGEVLGLCGENGAGKSTILKVLTGVHPFGTYEGSVKVFGEERRFRGTPDAQAAGIAIVHQELMLVPELTVAENLLLGREPRRFGLVDDFALEIRAREILRRFGFGDVDPRARTGALGIGVQQIVEIARALSFDAKVLVLDEPTAALTSDECARLFAIVRDLRARGACVLYVSHRMDEVFALCDRVTVMRDGRTAGTLTVADTTPREVVALMIGKEAPSVRAPKKPLDAADAPPVLRLDKLGLSSQSAAGRRVLDGVSLTVGRGEIVALCGAMGSGRTALLSTLFGCAEGAIAGNATLDGAPLGLASPREAIRDGVALLPEDRKGKGLILGMTVAENLALPTDACGDALAEAELARKRIGELRIRGDAETEAGALSGGNQQKVVLGKWLARPPKLLLLDEPTRGVDVGAREEIYALLEQIAARGTAILFASSDLPEIMRLAHRVLVLRQGRLTAELDACTATVEKLVLLATGAERARPAEGALEDPSLSLEQRLETCAP